MLVAVTRSKENSNIAGKNLASVKTPTHSSNEPTLSSTEVKFLSNPTIMTVIIGPMVDYNNIVIFVTIIVYDVDLCRVWKNNNRNCIVCTKSQI